MENLLLIQVFVLNLSWRKILMLRFLFGSIRLMMLNLRRIRLRSLLIAGGHQREICLFIQLKGTLRFLLELMRLFNLAFSKTSCCFMWRFFEFWFLHFFTLLLKLFECIIVLFFKKCNDYLNWLWWSFMFNNSWTC